VVLTMIIGFSWGGWVTGGAAIDQAKDAAEGARAELAADICAHRFLQADDASVQLAALKDESSYKRSSAIEKGGWVTLAGAKEPIDGAAQLCAEQLMQAEATPLAETAAAATAS
jgi:hypothetical protein